jgi:DNA-3-methyladenine glycosylase II
MAWLDTQSDLDLPADDEVVRCIEHLRSQDPAIASLINRYGIYKFEPTRNHFEVLLGTIVSQQLSTKAADSIYRKLLVNVGAKRPRPRHIIGASDEALRGAGLSRSKVSYVRNVAEWFATGRKGPGTFARMSDKEVTKALISIKGVGEWSAHMFLMFALNRLDVFPIGDLGLRNAMTQLYKLRKNTPLKRFVGIADKWAPYRTVASVYLWKSYDD